MDQEQEKLIEHQGLVLKIIWGFILISIIAMLVVSVFLPTPADTIKDNILPSVLLGVSLMRACISLGLFKFGFSDSQLKKRLKASSPNNSLNGSTTSLGNSLSEERTKGLHALVNTVSIVCWALNEAIAVLGLVSRVLFGANDQVYGFFVVALALQAMMYPKWDSIVERAKKLVH